MNKTRLEAFSDGVFAIVITLLILNVKLPETDYSNLGKALTDILPTIGIYIMSFLLVGMYWIFHHYSFTLIGQVDGILLWMNILLLLFISFMPFPAMLMGKYPFTTLPVIIYGGNLLLTNLTGFIMLMYLRKNQSLASAIFTDAIFKQQLKTYIWVNCIYALALVAGFFWPVISYLVFAIMAIALIVRSILLSGVGKCKT
jgi:uncharacterized membrane protein